MGSRNHLRFLGIDQSGMKNRFLGKRGGAWGMNCWEGGREESSCPLPYSSKQALRMLTGLVAFM